MVVLKINILYLVIQNMGAMREIAACERFLFHVIMDQSSLQVCHFFLQPSYMYVCNLIYGVASAAVEESYRKLQCVVPYISSAVLQ